MEHAQNLINNLQDELEKLAINRGKDEHSQEDDRENCSCKDERIKSQRSQLNATVKYKRLSD